MATPAEAINIRRQRQRSVPPVLEYGTVQAVGVTTATVICVGRAEILPYGRTLDGLIGIGDRVAVLRAGMVAYIAESFRTSTSSDPKPPGVPPVLPKKGTRSFVALDARTYQNGAWRTDTAAVIQGDPGDGSNVGAWFYGFAANAALTDVTAVASRVLLTRRTGGSNAPVTAKLYLHFHPTRPAGALSTVAGPVDVELKVNAPTWADIPPEWATQIISNGYGLAISGADYVPLKGLDETPSSGQLQIEWTRA